MTGSQVCNSYSWDIVNPCVWEFSQAQQDWRPIIGEIVAGSYISTQGTHRLIHNIFKNILAFKTLTISMGLLCFLCNEIHNSLHGCCFCAVLVFRPYLHRNSLTNMSLSVVPFTITVMGCLEGMWWRNSCVRSCLVWRWMVLIGASC